MNLLPKLANLLQLKSNELNLFSAADREKLESKHFPDAQVVLDYWHVEDGDSVLDIGTGGGIPGLVLAVEKPEVRFVLLDSTKKKLDAVKDVADELGLENVEVAWGRCEALAHEGGFREKFDVVTARALAPLPVLLEYAAGFLKEGGVFYAWKSSDYLDELKDSEIAQETLGMTFEDAYEYELPGGEPRSLLKFIKVGRLNAKYPRKVGMPSKSPLS